MADQPTPDVNSSEPAWSQHHHVAGPRHATPQHAHTRPASPKSHSPARTSEGTRSRFDRHVETLLHVPLPQHVSEMMRSFAEVALRRHSPSPSVLEDAGLSPEEYLGIVDGLVSGVYRAARLHGCSHDEGEIVAIGAVADTLALPEFYEQLARRQMPALKDNLHDLAKQKIFALRLDEAQREPDDGHPHHPPEHHHGHLRAAQQSISRALQFARKAITSAR